MSDLDDRCASIRGNLRELMLERSPEGTWPPAVRTHVAECPACRSVAEGLGRLPVLFRSEGLYTAELRRRTLARTAEAAEPIGAGRLILMILASGASLVASAAVPLWVLSGLIGAVCPTTVCALAGAGAIFLLLGVATVVPMAVTVLKSFQFGEAAASRSGGR